MYFLFSGRWVYKCEGLVTKRWVKADTDTLSRQYSSQPVIHREKENLNSFARQR